MTEALLLDADKTAAEMNADHPAFEKATKEVTELPDRQPLTAVPVVPKDVTEIPGPTLLTEAARRRPDFRGGTPITLSDGTAWSFPRPVLTGFTFAHNPDGSDRIAGETSFGDDYDRLVDDFIDAQPGPAESVALYRVASYLLRVNYDLDHADTRKLLKLVIRDGSPAALANETMWQAITDAVLGKKNAGTSTG